MRAAVFVAAVFVAVFFAGAFALAFFALAFVGAAFVGAAFFALAFFGADLFGAAFFAVAVGPGALPAVRFADLRPLRAASTLARSTSIRSMTFVASGASSATTTSAPFFLASMRPLTRSV